MEKHRLVCHPHTPSLSVEAVEVEILAHDAADMVLLFSIAGTADLVLPKGLYPGRADKLWTTTCFELFLKPANADAYFEFNFAPSNQWAAYRFAGYRAGGADADIAPPSITTRSRGDRFELRASLGIPAVAAFRVALSVVIEESNGTKSYWALAHPPGKADFHHPDSFILELPLP